MLCYNIYDISSWVRGLDIPDIDRIMFNFFENKEDDLCGYQVVAFNEELSLPYNRLCAARDFMKNGRKVYFIKKKDDYVAVVSCKE